MPEWLWVQLTLMHLQPLILSEASIIERILLTSILVMPTTSALSQSIPSSPPQSIHTALM